MAAAARDVVGNPGVGAGDVPHPETTSERAHRLILEECHRRGVRGALELQHRHGVYFVDGARPDGSPITVASNSGVTAAFAIEDGFRLIYTGAFPELGSAASLGAPEEAEHVEAGGGRAVQACTHARMVATGPPDYFRLSVEAGV